MDTIITAGGIYVNTSGVIKLFLPVLELSYEHKKETLNSRTACFHPEISSSNGEELVSTDKTNASSRVSIHFLPVHPYNLNCTSLVIFNIELIS